MEYDLQILVPTIPKRIEGFKKHGLYNVGNKKVLLNCLIGTNDKKIYKNDWPDNVEVKLISSPSDNPVFQIYNFLYNLSFEQANCSKWFAKIDDDTFNDISKSIDHLNEFYNSEEDFYIVAQIQDDMDDAEKDSLKQCKLWDKIGRRFTHEFQCCWFSKKSICKIVQNEDCKELFKVRMAKEYGYTDQCMGAAAKLCKIYPVNEHRFCMDQYQFTRCSIFGGDLFHFHPICKDKHAINWNIINNYIPPKE